ncbi:DDE-type integrase/transposase/recombinase [Seinonella peptonophila]|uniref:DDE-type integrase/transposase/recombinase n=1 Tax=Seinonella peptonophila TaxID=112248 RepID=UPI003BF60AC1
MPLDGFSYDKPNHLYVTDITNVSMNQRFYYFSAIQLFNNEIVVWHLSNQNDLRLVMDTLEKLIQQRDVWSHPSFQIKASNALDSRCWLRKCQAGVFQILE